MSYGPWLSFGGTRTRRAHRASRDLTSPDPRPSESGRADRRKARRKNDRCDRYRDLTGDACARGNEPVRRVSKKRQRPRTRRCAYIRRHQLDRGRLSDGALQLRHRLPTNVGMGEWFRKGWPQFFSSVVSLLARRRTRGLAPRDCELSVEEGQNVGVLLDPFIA